MSDPRRILLLMAEAGFGHRSAAQALAAALQQRYGDRCLIEIFNPLGDERTIGLMRGTQTSYDQFVRQRPDLYRASFEFSDQTVPSAVIDGAYMITLFDTLRSKLHSFEPDAIVSVYQAYAAPLGAIYAVIQNLPICRERHLASGSCFAENCPVAQVLHSLHRRTPRNSRKTSSAKTSASSVEPRNSAPTVEDCGRR